MMLKSDFQFQRCVDRYKGYFRTRRFTCSEHFLVMSFAQLAGRESLRDIECNLTAFSSKLYHFGLRSANAKSTLAEANEKRNWKIYADYAQVLIKQARPLYADDPNFRLDINNMVYALDSTTIDLCLSLYTFTQTIGLTLFEKTDIKELFSGNINLTNLSDYPILPLWES